MEGRIEFFIEKGASKERRNRRRRRIGRYFVEENKKHEKELFQEQLEMYEKHKNSQPGIFALHDEDSANVILSKYKLKTGRPD